MSIDFVDMINVSGINGIPDEFYTLYDFKIVVRGSQIAYHVQEKEDFPSVGQVVSKEQLLAMCTSVQLKKTDKTMSGFLKRIEEPNPTVKSTRVDPVPNLITYLARVREKTELHDERELFLFLLKEVIFAIKNKGKFRLSFLEERAKNTSLLETVPSISSFFFPGRIASGFQIDHSEIEIFEQLPECLKHSNQDLKILKWNGRIEILPPVVATERYAKLEHRNKMTSELRKAQSNFLKRLKRILTWDKRNDQCAAVNYDLQRKWNRLPLMKILSSYKEKGVKEMIQEAPTQIDKPEVQDFVAKASIFAKAVLDGWALPIPEMRRFPLLKDLYGLLTRPWHTNYIRLCVENTIRIFRKDKKTSRSLDLFLRKRPGEKRKAKVLIQKMYEYLK